MVVISHYDLYDWCYNTPDTNSIIERMKWNNWCNDTMHHKQITHRWTTAISMAKRTLTSQQQAHNNCSKEPRIL